MNKHKNIHLKLSEYRYEFLLLALLLLIFDKIFFLQMIPFIWK